MVSEVNGRSTLSELPTVELAGHRIAACSLEELLSAVFADMKAGIGGWLMTLNVDLAFQASSDPAIAELQCGASVVVADGMPLVWASKIRGTPIPERIAGSDLVFHLSERCARESRSLYLLGGDPGAATRASAQLLERWPLLEIAGTSNPILSNPPTAPEIAAISESLGEAKPNLVLVAFGSPKTERLIDALRPELSSVWWVGVGIGLGFAAGQVQRAPVWMRRIGAEWLHRLSREPGRLARRYLVDDVPFAARLLAAAVRDRLFGLPRRS